MEGSQRRTRRRLGGFSQRLREKGKKQYAKDAVSAIINDIINTVVTSSGGEGTGIEENATRIPDMEDNDVETIIDNMEKGIESRKRLALEINKDTSRPSDIIDVDAIQEDETVPRKNNKRARSNLKRKSKEDARMEIKRQLIAPSSSSESSDHKEPPLPPYQAKGFHPPLPAELRFRGGSPPSRADPYPNYKLSGKKRTGPLLVRESIIPAGTVPPPPLKTYRFAKTIEYAHTPPQSRGSSLATDATSTPDNSEGVTATDQPAVNTVPPVRRTTDGEAVVTPDNAKTNRSSVEHLNAVISQLSTTQALMKRSQDEHALAADHFKKAQAEHSASMNHLNTSRRFLDSAVRTLLAVKKKESDLANHADVTGDSQKE